MCVPESSIDAGIRAGMRSARRVFSERVDAFSRSCGNDRGRILDSGEPAGEREGISERRSCRRPWILEEDGSAST